MPNDWAARGFEPRSESRAPMAAGMQGPEVTNMVFWDIEECPMPDNLEASQILPTIKEKLSSWGFRGPVKMRAVHVNNYANISPKTCQELSASGINLEHIEFHVDDDDDDDDFPSWPIVVSYFVDWILRSPLPANVWFISMDRQFFTFYNQLEEHKYNILKIKPELVDWKKGYKDLCSWTWSDILCGGPPQGTLCRGPPQGTLKRSRSHNELEADCLSKNWKDIVGEIGSVFPCLDKKRVCGMSTLQF